MNKQSNKPKYLAIFTLGGSQQPVIKSIQNFKPKRVIFICSEESKKDFENKINMEKQFPDLEKDRVSYIVLDNHDDILKTVKNIKEKLEPEHKKWILNGEGYKSIIDFTGGTKCMSASITLIARSWKQCVFSYTGGKKRDKEGLGVVKTGHEKIIQTYSPYEVLGYQAVEKAALLYNRHSYSESHTVLKNAFESIIESEHTDSPVYLKEELCASQKWVEAYKNWDDFHHKQALNKLKRTQEKQLNNLKSAFKGYELDFEFVLSQSIKYLQNIVANPEQEEIKNSPYLIFDVIANAERRAEQGRFDDAVGRLYRAVEAMAQYRLWEEYEIDSSRVPFSSLSASLKASRSECAAKSKIKEKKSSDPQEPSGKLGLQESYRFLYDEKKDLLGKKFLELGLASWKAGCLQKNNPLAQRNNSILAHGFNPVNKKAYEDLRKSTCALFLELKTLYSSSLKDGEFLDFENESHPHYFPKLKPGV